MPSAHKASLTFPLKGLSISPVIMIKRLQVMQAMSGW